MTEPTEQEVERACKYLRGMETLSDDDYDPLETVAKLLESLSSRLAAERRLVAYVVERELRRERSIIGRRWP